MKINDENFDLLAKEIVIQGVEDYKKALKQKWALENKLNSVKKTIIECEKFFNSQWCAELSNISDPNYIKDNAFLTAEKEYDEKEIVSVSISIKLKEKTNKKQEEES